MTKQHSEDVACKAHPDAPHGFVRDSSHTLGRYVCECEFWCEPDEKKGDSVDKAREESRV